MNVHDIHAKGDATLLAGLREASSVIEPPTSLDPAEMARRAVRTVRRRRVATLVTVGFAVLAVTGAGIGVAGTVYVERSQTLPGADRVVAQPSDQYLATGGGRLPVLDGVEHGVTESPGANPYILGGLWYEVPPGGWYAVGDVNAGGQAGFLAPDDPRANGTGDDDPLTMSIDDLDATLELRNVTDVAGWTAPAPDSGATTVAIDGADLVVVEQHERTGTVRPATIRIRSGDEGWVIETRFAADEQGETMLRNFVGNLWLEDEGEPDWFAPQFEHPQLDPAGGGVPTGWTEAAYDGLTFAVPKGWRSTTPDGDPTAGVEWTGDTVTHVVPGTDPETLDLWTEASPKEKAKAAQDVDSFERIWVEHGLPGGESPVSAVLEPESQVIEVPGADSAEVAVTLNNVDGEPDYYGARFHVEGFGESLSIDVEFDGTKQGLADLNAFAGSLDLRR